MSVFQKIALQGADMDKYSLLFVVGTLAASGLLLTSYQGFAGGLAVAVVAFTILWLVSLPIRNASIVDIFWGIGFVALGWYYLSTASEHATFRGIVVCSLVTVWGLRLALHILIRNSGAGEDFRYRKWRDEAGSSFWWISLVKVFLIQAVLLWIVSSPLLMAQLETEDPSFGPLDVLGFGLWLFGFLFEAIADLQLARFKSDPDNAGKVMQSGLWSLSRHPNYFGEAVLWWGIGLLTWPAGGVLSFIGPLMITFLLLKISGVAMLDAALTERRPGYDGYIRTTPAFLPLGKWRPSWHRRATKGA
jgi:steroid 5-alpha reductase family enzyme